jgi:glycosyltransferase involved in cell wall biosynthesis
MAFKSTVRAGLDILKRYGLKTFLKQMRLKLSGHHFERATEFMNRTPRVKTDRFEPSNARVPSLLSVVVPCYNHEDFVKDALQSIFLQSYRDIEIIVIDDCSKDNSASIIKSLFKSFSKEKRFYKQTFIQNKVNKGAHYSINTGINLCCGEYIAILNSDDLYAPNRFEVLVEKLNEQKAGVAFSKVSIIDEKGTVKEKSPFSAIQKNIEQAHMFYGLCSDNLAISSGNLLFRRSVIEKIGLFRDFKYVHDWDLLLRSLTVCKQVFCEKTTYYYRMHATNSYLALNSMTALCDQEMTEVRAMVFKKVYGKKISEYYSRKDYDKIVDLLYRRLVNSSAK